MSDLPAVTTEKPRLVNIVGWGYTLVGSIIVALCLSSAARMIGQVGLYHSQTGQMRAGLLVFLLVMSTLALGFGGLLIGGGIYLRRRSESGRIALIVTSSVLIAFSLLRTLQSTAALLMLAHFESSGSFGVELRRQGLSMGLNLLFGLALGWLLVMITRPAVKNAMLPAKTTATPPPPPVTQAMQ